MTIFLCGLGHPKASAHAVLSCIQLLKALKALKSGCNIAGANLEVDIPYKWLQFFLDDDKELQDIASKYKAGKMLTGEVKKRLIEVTILVNCLWVLSLPHLECCV